jgi:alpha-N-arabinofuranosidase
MDDLLTRHSAIMDKADPEKRVGLIVDEWGAWYDVEPGTNPGFLYQQNSLRDALVAGMTLNIFNRHGGRVRMANIAQTVNVLQAMILTHGPNMIKTPTYHAFDLYKAHHDASYIPSTAAGLRDYACGSGGTIPQLCVSCSRNAEGRIHVTICNTSPHESAAILLRVPGSAATAHGITLTADGIDSHNTFDQPDAVAPAELAVDVTPAGLEATLPSKSVTLLSFSLE